MIRTQVYLPDELYQNIRLLAKREEKSAAELIRELLKRGLKNETKYISTGRAFLEIAKIKAKGPKDLSENIDKYLYEE